MNTLQRRHYDYLSVLVEVDEGSEEDFVSVIEARTLDDDGEEVDVEQALTERLLGIATCKDQGNSGGAADSFETPLRQQIEAALAEAGITVGELSIDME